MPGEFEMKTPPIQKTKGRCETNPLCRHGSNSGSGGSHVKIPDQYEIKHDINHTGQRHEIKRRFRITQPPQYTAHDVIPHDKKDSYRADQNITFRVGHSLHGSMHEHGDLPVEKRHNQGQDHTDNRKQPHRRTDR